MSPATRRAAATGPSSRRSRLKARAQREASGADSVLPIVTRGLTKTYGDIVAVDSLDLEINPGEIFGLLGQNGAGKTTTILMLLGLTEPTSGRARVVGLDPARNPLEVKRRVGYLPDSVGFYGGLTGRENLRYTARLNGLPMQEAEPRIEEVLAQVNMTARADSKTEEYSRGMLQRLGIADALVKSPDILILDEPTAAIDPIGVVEILDLLRELADEHRITILLSSHLLSQVQSTCDRVGIFAAGRLIGVGTVEELSRRFGEASARIEVTLDGTGDAAATEHARATLKAVPGVTSVNAPDRPRDPWVLHADPTRAGEVRVATLAAAARENLHLSAIREVEPSLDDIYRTALHDRGLIGAGRAA
ncbi:MAG TPA: ABC transporter ATP-binding protein [Candidatus Limnocylindrales bacterium]